MERRILFTHAGWTAAAVVAFVSGFSLAKARLTSESPAGESEVGLMSRTVLGVDGDGGGGAVKADESLIAARARAEGSAGGGRGVRRDLSVAEIEDLAREALKDASHLKRSLAFSKLLEALTPENAEMIREAMASMGAGGDEWRLFRYAWGAADGLGALEHAMKLEGRERAEFMGEALSGWASADPNAAMQWVGAFEGEDEEKGRLKWSLVSGLADHDTGMATDFVYKQAAEGDPNAARYLEQVAGEVLRTGSVEDAATWAERLPDGDLKGGALDTVANRFVASDPEAAASWAAQFADEPFGTRVIEEVGDEWAERDPGASVAWLEGLPDGRGKEDGMQSALGEWARRDPLAASEYLASMPDSPTKDHAVNGFARRLSYEDPASAVAWAQTIADDKMRVEALTRAGQQWFRRNAAAAAEWLSVSGLPPEAQDAVISPPRDERRDRWRGRG